MFIPLPLIVSEKRKKVVFMTHSPILMPNADNIRQSTPMQPHAYIARH